MMLKYEIIPRSPNRFGSVIFTFSDEGWAQGGMNEKGLFFDGALTPHLPIEFSPDLPKYKYHIWQAVLNQCATVEEALDFLEKYQLSELATTHIVLADAQGYSVILGSENGQLKVHQRTGPFQLQSNFNLSHPLVDHPDGCPRYQFAQKTLKSDASASIDQVKTILEGTHQDSLTIYSNIYDLKRQQVHIYHRANFSTVRTLDLNQILDRGYQVLALQDWFSASSYAPQEKINIKGTIQAAGSQEVISFVNSGFCGQKHRHPFR